MDSQLVGHKSQKTNILIAWTIIALSIFSCSSRPDYNIIIGFLILLLRSLSNQKLKPGLKGCIHIILISLIFDIIWIFQYYSYWRHGEDTSDLWKSLSLLHNITYYVGICEFLIKLPALFFLYQNFKECGTLGELISLNYSNKI